MFNSLLRILSTLVLLTMLAGCAMLPAAQPQPGEDVTRTPTEVIPPTVVPSATTAPSPTPVPTATQVPTPTAGPQGPRTGSTLTFDPSLASGINLETIAAVDEGNNNPYWEIAPEHVQINFTGYVIARHLHTPRIYIYPVDEFKTASDAAGKLITDLQALLKDRPAQVIQRLPFLPFFNAQQVFHAQMQYLDFKNGQGVRYVTQFDQAFIPLNNYELIYTYQGLTDDGKYYVAAVLPINAAGLPADGTVTDEMRAGEFGTNFTGYLEKVVQQLDGQPTSDFTPDLSKLDTMMASLEVK